MNKYHNGKIYKIVDVGYNKCYIGSTVKTLSQRMAHHRHMYRKQKEGLFHNVNSFSLFDEFGIDNCKIELIEYYKCETKDELLRREGDHIKNTDCVNKYVAGRTDREYYVEHRKIILQQMKTRAETKTEQIKEYKSYYYNKNKEDVLEKCKKYYQDNIVKVKLRQNEQFDCICGSKYNYSNKKKT